MSFATPLLLLCLLALPALGAWYASRQRTRRLATAAFAAPAMAPSATPHLPRLRRHLPMVAFALALALLIGAAARPRVTVTTVVKHLQTMLALDMSGSMQAHDVTPSRAAAAQHAADVFVGGVPAAVTVGVLQFNQAPQVLAAPTRNHRAVIEALGRLRIGGGTAIGSAVDTALALLRPAADPAGQTTGTHGAADPPGVSADPRAPSAAIVLLSDGKSTSGADPLAAARAARQLHIPIFTVAIGTPGGTISVRRRAGAGAATVPVPVESRELQEVARLSGGRTYTAADASHLSAIYRQLSARLSHHSERRDLTPYFLAAGLGLLLLGSALSLTWFGRLI
ncbi:MAG TPA: VWA domain-containing protein [Solirubrobacteraceae bacterium]|jgi:Ca-activated chloride channel family protein